MKYRFHLRHTGSVKPIFGVNPMRTGWSDGFSIRFGYWFIAVRRKTAGEFKAPFIDLKIGKGQQRDTSMRRSEAFKKGRQEGAQSVFDEWISEESFYWRIEDLLPRYGLMYEAGRVMPKGPQSYVKPND